jgi:hypothetical protein
MGRALWTALPRRSQNSRRAAGTRIGRWSLRLGFDPSSRSTNLCPRAVSLSATAALTAASYCPSIAAWHPESHHHAEPDRAGVVSNIRQSCSRQPDKRSGEGPVGAVMLTALAVYERLFSFQRAFTPPDLSRSQLGNSTLGSVCAGRRVALDRELRATGRTTAHVHFAAVLHGCGLNNRLRLADGARFGQLGHWRTSTKIRNLTE